MSLKTAVILPTYNGIAHAHLLIDALRAQTATTDLLLVDSGSTDGTLEAFKASGLIHELVEITTAQFNHGGTRQMMVDTFADYEVYILLTQDAYPADAYAFEQLIACFKDSQVGAACGRQLPHTDASPLAAHARYFNYPATSSIKSKADIAQLGIKVPFVSNSFSAYRAQALREVGGFPADVILSEDMYVAAKMVMQGWKVAYCAEAQVHHSHNYSLKQEWQRYFDIGVFHAQQAWIRQEFGGAGGEGLRFVRSELDYLKDQKWRWPTALLRNAGKLLAYKIGQKETLLPVWLKKRLSMHRAFW